MFIFPFLIIIWLRRLEGFFLVLTFGSWKFYYTYKYLSLLTASLFKSVSVAGIDWVLLKYCPILSNRSGNILWYSQFKSFSFSRSSSKSLNLSTSLNSLIFVILLRSIESKLFFLCWIYLFTDLTHSRNHSCN